MTKISLTKTPLNRRTLPWEMLVEMNHQNNKKIKQQNVISSPKAEEADSYYKLLTLVVKPATIMKDLKGQLASSQMEAKENLQLRASLHLGVNQITMND